MTIELGDIARDTITGFEGVVVARTDWLWQCRRIVLQPKGLHDSKPIESQSFDEPTCELVEKASGRIAEIARAKTDALPKESPVITGGPQPKPQRGR